MEARFDALVEERTGYPNINSVLKEMREHKADLLRVLQRPEIPLHNNAMESDIREFPVDDQPFPFRPILSHRCSSASTLSKDDTPQDDGTKISQVTDGPAERHRYRDRDRCWTGGIE